MVINKGNNCFTIGHTKTISISIHLDTYGPSFVKPDVTIDVTKLCKKYLSE